MKQVGRPLDENTNYEVQSSLLPVYEFFNTYRLVNVVGQLLGIKYFPEKLKRTVGLTRQAKPLTTEEVEKVQTLYVTIKNTLETL